MIIDELNLTSFGKFSNKKVTFKDGINIVYGDNEAGKTTIHKFMEGILFGFFKPYTKRKSYTEDYDRYFPWDKSEFGGTLKYTYKGLTYRIERNLTKGNDELKVYDDATGEEITARFPYDKVTRLYDPALVHLGLNRVVYSNTISIKQLGNKTEDDLSKEVKDSLINLGGSMDEDISVKKVVEKLTKEMDEIGTINRVKTSPYGKVVEELTSLEKERQEALKIGAQKLKEQEKLNSALDQLDRLESKRLLLEKEIELLEGYRARERYEKALSLTEEIKEFGIKIEDLKLYSKINPDDFTEAIGHDNSLKTMKDSHNGLMEKHNRFMIKLKRIIANLKEYEGFNRLRGFDEIEEIGNSYITLDNKKKEVDKLLVNIAEIKKRLEDASNYNIINLTEDYYFYEEMEREKDRIIYSNDNNNVVFLKTRLEEKEKSIKNLGILKILSVIGALAVAILGVLLSPIALTALIVPLGTLIYSFISTKELKKYTNKLKLQLNEIEEKESTIKEQLDKLTRDMEGILECYGCSSKVELRKMMADYSKDVVLLKDKEETILELENRVDTLRGEIIQHEAFMSKYLTLFEANNVSEITMDDMKNLKEQYNKYQDIKRNKEELDIQMKELKLEIDELTSKIQEYEGRIKVILKNNQVISIDDFKNALEMRKKYDRLIQDRESKENILKNILGDNSVEYLRKRAHKYENQSQESKNNDIDRDELEAQIKDIREKVNNLRSESVKLESNINNLTSKIRPLVNIEEDILRKEKVKNEYERKLKSLEIAKETIEKISKNIQRDFAPRLNKEVGSIIGGITGGKYNEVKITEDIDIKVVDPNSNKMVQIEGLSGGTIDQIYFATRFGIIDIIKGDDSLPLILDDCFVQYDISRLENILKFLGNEGNNRQIILFTCHRREKEIFDRLKLEYNYVEI